MRQVVLPIWADSLEQWQILQETDMTCVVLTARVKDGARWEKGFRAHADLLRRGGMSNIHYTIADSNDAVIYFETDDIEAFRSFAQSPENVRAMEEDGVEVSTVKVYPLEKDIPPS
jgi:hypothetical protein